MEHYIKKRRNPCLDINHQISLHTRHLQNSCKHVYDLRHHPHTLCALTHLSDNSQISKRMATSIALSHSANLNLNNPQWIFTQRQWKQDFYLYLVPTHFFPTQGPIYPSMSLEKKNSNVYPIPISKKLKNKTNNTSNVEYQLTYIRVRLCFSNNYKSSNVFSIE